METSDSGTNHAFFHAQSDRWGLGPIETINSGANHAVLHAHNDRWYLEPIEACNSDPKGAVSPGKTTDEGWEPLRLAILELKALFWMQKALGEVRDP